MNSVATFDWWLGAPFCMKIMQQWTCMCNFSFCLSNSTYFGPFIVVLGGMKYRPVTPQHYIAPQIIWIIRCFNVATTYFLAKHLPNGLLICMMWGTNCCMVHSSENKTFFHSARVEWQWYLAKFSSSMVSGVAFVPVCGNSVQCWTLWWVQNYLSHCLLSSLGIVFHWWPDLFVSWNMPSALNLMIALCIAVLEQCNLAAMSLSVYNFPCKVTICACQRKCFAWCMT